MLTGVAAGGFYLLEGPPGSSLTAAGLLAALFLTAVAACAWVCPRIARLDDLLDAARRDGLGPEEVVALARRQAFRQSVALSMLSGSFVLLMDGWRAVRFDGLRLALFLTCLAAFALLVGWAVAPSRLEIARRLGTRRAASGRARAQGARPT